MENEEQVIVPQAAILSPLGQQRYAMMQEVNQTIATMIGQRIASTYDCDGMRRISLSLAQKIAKELESQE